MVKVAEKSVAEREQLEISSASDAESSLGNVFASMFSVSGRLPTLFDLVSSTVGMNISGMVNPSPYRISFCENRSELAPTIGTNVQSPKLQNLCTLKQSTSCVHVSFSALRVN